MIRIYTQNSAGRDFIIGDLHGNHVDLMRLLDAVNFDTAIDRLFSVGDLVDRGLASVKCMQLLDNPWFHSVKGNHEELTVCGATPSVAQREFEYIHKMNGGIWAYHPENQEYVQQYLDKLAELPDCIEVKDSFSIIHAEPPYLKKTDLTNFLTGKWYDYECFDGVTHLWGRQWFLNFYARDPAKLKSQPIPISSVIDTCYVGHTPILKPTRLGFLVNLDTGSGKQGNLTMHCHTTNETFTAVESKVINNTIYNYAN